MQQFGSRITITFYTVDITLFIRLLRLEINYQLYTWIYLPYMVLPSRLMYWYVNFVKLNQARRQGCSQSLVCPWCFWDLSFFLFLGFGEHNKTANYRQISMFKVSMEVYWQNTSIYQYKIFLQKKINSKMTNMNLLHFLYP